MPHQPFRGHIPEDRHYCCEYDMWVREDGNQVLIGITGFGLFLAGEIIAFTAKPKGAEIERGRGMGTIECRKTVLALHAPLSIVLQTGNEAAEERPSLINKAPYDAAWLLCGHPTRWTSEQSTLCDAAAYRQHILRIEPEACFDD